MYNHSVCITLLLTRSDVKPDLYKDFNTVSYFTRTKLWHWHSNHCHTQRLECS